ncbi:hypothetical protein CDAR_515431 [Caerostris darwini]|uniref:Uncharacterized protein n=1 Tax=Caerostris darwini TaxID=1538125 RepID=A0AAV4W4J6_9ARAC|nr:hypothetical protein CDAR_515431 [Caerostris darwini]
MLQRKTKHGALLYKMAISPNLSVIGQLILLSANNAPFRNVLPVSHLVANCARAPMQEACTEGRLWTDPDMRMTFCKSQCNNISEAGDSLLCWGK